MDVKSVKFGGREKKSGSTLRNCGATDAESGVKNCLTAFYIPESRAELQYYSLMSETEKAGGNVT